jgi:propane monooxygenase reductase subunit
MGDKHTIRLQPVDIEFEVDEDETILDGAFRQGLMLMHGCKEGQCAACKSFVLEGEVDMDKYSTFALPDFEEAEGWTLLCKAHAVSDVDIELVNYDEEVLRSGIPTKEVVATVAALEPLTSDIWHLALDLDPADGFEYKPGQYVDITIPGTDEVRSFSMASVPSTPDRLEFMIRHYPGGRFAGGFADGTLHVGSSLAVKGPFGSFTLRARPERRLLFIGGGAGMAPIVSLLRARRESGCTRRSVFYYGARGTADLFQVDELEGLQQQLADFAFVPVLSDADPGPDWTGETGFVTDVVARLEGDLGDVDAYLCGPPPMVDAAMELLLAQGLAEDRIYFDKFTTSAETEGSSL